LRKEKFTTRKKADGVPDGLTSADVYQKITQKKKTFKTKKTVAREKQHLK